MINWDSKYELGIESIDKQHKELVRIIGDLSELLVHAKMGQDIFDDMSRIVDELTQYTIIHFKYEEELFDIYNYEFKTEHKEEHDKLVNEVVSLDLSQVDEDPVLYGNKILKFLITWVFKHISGSDNLYKNYLIECGVK
jgi:hemerythrin-like metal-binding protein